MSKLMDWITKKVWDWIIDISGWVRYWFDKVKNIKIEEVKKDFKPKHYVLIAVIIVIIVLCLPKLIMDVKLQTSINSIKTSESVIKKSLVTIKKNQTNIVENQTKLQKKFKINYISEYAK